MKQKGKTQESKSMPGTVGEHLASFQTAGGPNQNSCRPLQSVGFNAQMTKHQEK